MKKYIDKRKKMSTELKEHMIDVLAEVVESYSEDRFSEDFLKKSYLEMTPEKKALLKEKLAKDSDPLRSFWEVRREYFNIYNLSGTQRKKGRGYRMDLKKKFETILSYASANEVPDYDSPVYFDVTDEIKLGKKKYGLTVEAYSSEYATILLYLYLDLASKIPHNTRVEDITEVDLRDIIGEMRDEFYSEELFKLSSKVPKEKTLITRDVVENMIKSIGLESSNEEEDEEQDEE